MKKAAIVIGHTALRKGAYSPYLGMSEFDFNKKVAESLRDVSDIYTHESYNLGYTSMVKRTAAKINKNDYDLVLELHFNSSDKPEANGSEALCYFSNKKAKHLAIRFCELMADTYSIRPRGAKALYNKNQRGFAAVFYPKPTTLILEPFFGSNNKDVDLFIRKGGVKAYQYILKNLIHEAIL